MTRKRQARVLSVLLRRADWVTAGYLADHLGVTARSVRSYVTAINSQAAGGDAIESGPQGYRATPSAGRVRLGDPEGERGSPLERRHALLRLLLDQADGVDPFEVAARLHVSDSTVEGDLRRVRALLEESDLRLERADGLVRIAGDELARRRLVSRVVHAEIDEGAFDLEALRRAAEVMDLPAGAFADFGRSLVERLTGLGYVVNELSAASVVLHVAIAADRVAHGHALRATAADPDPDRARVAEVVTDLAREHFGAEMGEGDRHHLASLMLLSIVDHGSSSEPARDADPHITRAVRDAVGRAAETYGLRISGDVFVERLSLHVQNLVRRAEEQLWSRNPMTRSLKSASPMLFEVAVAIAADLSTELGVAIPDDEIADIAMHLGSALELDRHASTTLTAAIVCPGYGEMRRRLRESVARAVGHEIEIIEISTRSDPDWGAFDADLVLTTIDPPATDAADRIVRIPPFLSDRDALRIAEATNRIRRQRRMSGLRAEMERWFVPDAFRRDIDGSGPEEIIRALGAPLVAAGIIDEDYIDSSIERERLSSTAFTESLAVPHAITMSATRTAIAIAVNEQAVPWGSERVHVVALAAFAEADREAFQTVFEQFVDVFADPDNAHRITRRAFDLPSFLLELSALIDDR